MKRFLAIIWIFCSFNLSSQQIVDAEYYIDDDPGFGLGTPITITANQDISDLLISIDVSGISEGIHNLIVRAKDENGSWSLAHKQTFLKNQLPSSSPINALEYFFDIDPGKGSGTPISISANVDISNHLTAISTSGLSEGVHQLFIRSRSNEGVWSHAYPKSVFISPPIVNKDIIGLEYYVGADPGYGNGNLISVAAANDLSNISAVIPIGNLNFGLNNISVRALDSDGLWSHCSTKAILKMKVPNVPDIEEIEYFFNDDPGFGNGTFVSYSPGPDWSDLSVLISVNGLSNGIHVLNIRSRDSNGLWSLTHSTILQKSTIQELSDIIAMEYFFDVDPGFGSGTPISITSGNEIDDKVTTISVSGLQKGVHTLHVRSKNELGEWSLNSKKSILVAYPKVETDIVEMEYYFDTDPGHGFGNEVSLADLPDISDLNSIISLSGLAVGVHHLHFRSKNSGGVWSHDYSKTFFYRKPDVEENIVEMEYFIGDDPGFGNGIEITVPSISAVPDIVDLQHLIDLMSLDAGVQRINIRSKNDLGVWSHTHTMPVYVNKTVNGDMVKAEYFIDTDPGYGMATEVTFAPETNKSNHIIPIDISGLEFGIYRLHVRYMSENNKWTLDDITPFLFKDGELYEMVEGEYFIDEDPGLGLATSFTYPSDGDVSDISLLVMTSGLDPGDHDLYIRTKNANGEWSLTNVKFDIDIQGVLPLSILSFEVSKLGEDALLEWKVTDAFNSSHFDVERSDWNEFESIGRIESINEPGELEYKFLDEDPFNGWNYYRLKQIDLDGAYEYSATRAVSFGAKKSITVYPNPSIDEIRIEGLVDENTSYMIYNSESKLVKQGTLENDVSIDIRDLLPGGYHLVFQNGSENNSFLIIKI